MNDPRDPGPRSSMPHTVIGTPTARSPAGHELTTGVGPPLVTQVPVEVGTLAGTEPTAAMPVVPAPPPGATPVPFIVPDRPDPYLGMTIADRYRLERKLGEGGMGIVYQARHVVLEKAVAVKILAEDLARRPDLVQRFLHEAKAASRIHHENIVDITDFGQTPSGMVFFVMELLEGRDLATLIRREAGALPWQRAKPILVQICRALEAAHQNGIIHRDMKPENVFLVAREGNRDFAKVLDFGIAKMTGMEEKAGSRLTRTGMIFGTPEYMSPEQAQGTHPDHRVDIYAVGVITYEMLTARVPFRADTFMGVLTKHMFEAPVPPSLVRPDLGIPAELDAIVMRALDKDRERRFQSMAELGQVIANASGTPTTFGFPGAGAGTPNVGDRASPSSAGAHETALLPPGGTAALPRPMSVAAPYRGPTASRVGLWIGVVTAVLLLGGGVGFVLLTRAPATVARATSDAGTALRPAPPPLAAGAPDAAVGRIEISVRSRPPGAEVFRGSEKLGQTPARLDFPAGPDEIALTLRKPGFEDRALRVVADRNREFELDLAPARRHGGKPRPAPEPGKSPDRSRIPELKDPFSDG